VQVHTHTHTHTAAAVAAGDSGTHLIRACAAVPAREGEVQALLDAVGVAIGAHARGEAVARGGGRDQGADAVSHRHSGRGRAAAAPLLDQCTTTQRNLGSELLLEPPVSGERAGWGGGAYRHERASTERKLRMHKVVQTSRAGLRHERAHTHACTPVL